MNNNKTKTMCSQEEDLFILGSHYFIHINPNSNSHPEELSPYNINQANIKVNGDPVETLTLLYNVLTAMGIVITKINYYGYKINCRYGSLLIYIQLYSSKSNYIICFQGGWSEDRWFANKIFCDIRNHLVNMNVCTDDFIQDTWNLDVY